MLDLGGDTRPCQRVRGCGQLLPASACTAWAVCKGAGSGASCMQGSVPSAEDKYQRDANMGLVYSDCSGGARHPTSSLLPREIIHYILELKGKL